MLTHPTSNLSDLSRLAVTPRHAAEHGNPPHHPLPYSRLHTVRFKRPKVVHTSSQHQLQRALNTPLPDFNIQQLTPAHKPAITQLNSRPHRQTSAPRSTTQAPHPSPQIHSPRNARLSSSFPSPSAPWLDMHSPARPCPPASQPYTRQTVWK